MEIFNAKQMDLHMNYHILILVSLFVAFNLLSYAHTLNDVAGLTDKKLIQY
jgi:hypothetical protein